MARSPGLGARLPPAVWAPDVVISSKFAFRGPIMGAPPKVPNGTVRMRLPPPSTALAPCVLQRFVAPKGGLHR
eukprot:2170533-Pyramimonas_sp.AAC.1